MSIWLDIQVIEVGQLNSRSYNDRQGQQQTIIFSLT